MSIIVNWSTVYVSFSSGSNFHLCLFVHAVLIYCSLVIHILVDMELHVFVLFVIVFFLLR